MREKKQSVGSAGWTPPPDNAKLRSILTLMREFGVRRLVGDGFEIEMGDLPPAHAEPGAVPEQAARAPVLAPEELCACGHPSRSEHSDDGCLHGCPVSICETRPGQQPKE